MPCRQPYDSKDTVPPRGEVSTSNKAASPLSKLLRVYVVPDPEARPLEAIAEFLVDLYLSKQAHAHPTHSNPEATHEPL